MSEPQAPGPDPAMTAATEHLGALVRDLRSTADAIDFLLANPGDDRAHFYLEGIRLAAATIHSATVRRDSLAATARTSRERVSLPRISRVAGVSVNTLRARLPSVSPNQAVDFDEF